MSKSNTFENELLDHIFLNADITLIGDAAGLQNSAANGSLYLSLHTSDPGEAGDQTTNEIAYTGYARVAVARTAGGFTRTANEVFLVAAATFGEMTAGAGGTVTHFGVGASSAGAGKLLYKGAVAPTLAVVNGVVPELTTGTKVSED
jgi:hypothetical protein